MKKRMTVPQAASKSPGGGQVEGGFLGQPAPWGLWDGAPARRNTSSKCTTRRKIYRNPINPINGAIL